jgi:hypothetical protein
MSKRHAFRVLAPSSGADANWHVTDANDTMVAHCFGFGHSVSGGEAFANRIALCLNACVGLTDEQLAHQTIAAGRPVGREVW